MHLASALIVMRKERGREEGVGDRERQRHKDTPRERQTRRQTDRDRKRTMNVDQCQFWLFQWLGVLVPSLNGGVSSKSLKSLAMWLRNAWFPSEVGGDLPG